MSFEIPNFLSYLVAYATLFGMLYSAFNAAEKLLRPEAKHQIGDWLAGKHSERQRLFGHEWTNNFISFFDLLFAPSSRRGASFVLPGFLRSAAFSMSFVLMLGLFFGSLGLLKDAAGSNVTGFVRAMGFLGLVLNLVPDYLSIIETRYVLHLMRRSKWPYMLILLDALITLCLPPIAIVIFLLAVGEGVHQSLEFSVLYFVTWTWASGFEQLFFFNVFIYSTFLTSLWIWLYALGDLITRFLRRVDVIRNLLDRLLVLEERPLSVMGWLLIATMTVVFVGYLGMSALIQSLA